MKNLILTLVFAISFSVQSQEKINWITNIEEGLKLGKEQNKIVFIYFGAKKCVPCRSVEKYEYSNPEFIKYSKDLIMVKIFDDLDKEKVDWQSYIQKSRKTYKIKINPRFILIKNGEEIASFFTYVRKPGDLLTKFKTYISE
ncbi:thioredoxin family protein [Polaribacter cellanae]|uniref:Thioredoxin family protein n=1 Tax=Polaribacter cellanae TaxID=2818493 RepID=A0A975CQB5_9FLAO|nr:thioredoxin family protein [Polaribacter cellanae]QTE22760.1 thioredoxin family protein [Polaribacter cellanae]